MGRWTGRVERRQTLAAGDLAAIRALAERCNRADGLDLKLNWDLMQTRSPEVASDFFARDGGRLIGYAALDGDGAELELTGMVEPDHRRRGIFGALVAAARQECRRRGTARLLLVSERASASGRAFATATGGRFAFAEYRLALASATVPALPAEPVRLRRVGPADVGLLAELQARYYAAPGETPAVDEQGVARRVQEPGSRYYLAYVRGELVGSIGAITEEGQVYIRGVGILPEHRRRGHGRRMLLATIAALRAEGQTRFALDVVTENERALDLYRSCGFREANVYEYYDTPLDEPR